MGTWLLRTARGAGALARDAGGALARFTAALLDALPDPAWRELVLRSDGEGEAALVLHPAEEPLRCALEGDALRVEGRTSSAGPGYHAFVADLLDAAAARCGFAWDPPPAGDYLATRDFAALQRETSGWLREVGERLAALAGEGCTALNVSMALVVVDEARIASPLGLRAPAWFEETARAEGAALAARAAEHFPWWRRGLDAEVWARAGLVIAWSELPWRAPRDREEERQHRRALLCFSRARALDPSHAEAAGLEAQVRALLDARGQPLVAPAADGIGFRRRLLRWSLPGGWTIELPGYFLTTVERDGEAKVFFFPGRTVRVSTLSFTGHQRPSAEELLARHPEVEDPLRFTRGHLQGLAGFTQEQDETGPLSVLQGAVAGPGELCLVTVSVSDPALRDWAAQVWSSAFHPGPGEVAGA